MKCKFAPRYRVTIKTEGGRAHYGIAGRRYDPLIGKEVRRDIDDVGCRLEDVRWIVRLLNARCVWLEGVALAVVEMME